jgi:predicted transglutaminase-like cysteine proteinase
MYQVSGQPVGAASGRPIRTRRLRNVAAIGGVTLGVLAWAAAATASRDTTAVGGPSTRSPSVSVDTSANTAPVPVRADGTITRLELRPAIWNAAVASAAHAGADRLWTPPPHNPEQPALPSRTYDHTPDRAIAPTKVPRGMHVFGSVPLAASSKALRAMTDRVFAASQDWTVPKACHENPVSADCLRNVPPNWRALLQEAGGLAPLAAARRVNAEVNSRIAYASDTTLHGVPELWSRAVETIEKGAGDCEDYAILKMWLLARLGVDLDDMSVVVVSSDRLSTQHAVLALRIDDTIVILDNLLPAATPAREIAHYVPVFSVNATGLWLHGVADKQKVSDLAR